MPIEGSGARGRVVFEATHQARDGRLHWHIDDRYMGSTEVVHELPVAPAPGPTCSPWWTSGSTGDAVVCGARRGAVSGRVGAPGAVLSTDTPSR